MLNSEAPNSHKPADSLNETTNSDNGRKLKANRKSLINSDLNNVTNIMQADSPSRFATSVRKDLAALSRNMTSILESLLKNYNNKIRPGYREGKLNFTD